MGQIRWVRCKKFRCDFVARTFVLIPQVHAILHRVSCSYETIPNAPKHYATYQNMILWSYGMDQVHSLRKITKWLCGTNFCNNCNSAPCFAPSFMQLRNDPKCIQTLRNTPKHEFRVSYETNFCINCTSLVCFATSFRQLRNNPKCTQILRNWTKH